MVQSLVIGHRCLEGVSRERRQQEGWEGNLCMSFRHAKLMLEVLVVGGGSAVCEWTHAAAAAAEHSAYAPFARGHDDHGTSLQDAHEIPKHISSQM